MSELEALKRTVERLEATEAIRQLVAEYARLIDAKDLRAVANLFVEDIAVGTETGRDAKYQALVNNHGGSGRFRTTIHLVMGHSITIDTPGTASGVVYCRAEHELGDSWVIATIQYWDRYVRHDDHWLFQERDIKAFYVVDVLERPNGDRIKQKLTNFGVLETAELPAAWPSWGQFWEEQGRA